MITVDENTLGQYLVYRPADSRFSTTLLAEADDAEALAKRTWDQDTSKDVLILQVVGTLTRK